MIAQSKEQIIEWFAKYRNENFDSVEPKLSTRPDLHAFLVLDSIHPGTTDMIPSAHHDQFYLDPEVSDLVGKITEEQVRDLARCGVLIEDDDYLYMFV